MIKNNGCPKTMLSIKDALEALEGRWKLLILFSFSDGSKRFGQLMKAVPGITDKTLSKELKRLEENKLIKRTIQGTFPPTVFIRLPIMDAPWIMYSIHYTIGSFDTGRR